MKVRVGDRLLHTAGSGNGPVSAPDIAFRQAPVPVYPELASIHLVDYKVRIVDGVAGTRAVTRVLIDSRDDSQEWCTVGASTNIIEASFGALVDSLEYGLWIRGVRPHQARPALEVHSSLI